MTKKKFQTKSKQKNNPNLKQVEKKSRKKQPLIIATTIALIIICFLFYNRSFQNDTFYSIKIGESILKNGIDFKDHFSWHSHLIYMYPHWLYDIIVYLIYAQFKFPGISAFTLIIYLLLVLTIYKASLSLTNNQTLTSLLILICAIALSPYLTTRAQSLSYLIFILEVYFIEKATETNQKKYYLYLIILSTLLANIHPAVFPFYFVLFLPYLAEHLIAKLNFLSSKKISSKFSIEKLPHPKPLIITIIACFLTGLLTPIKDMPYTYTLRIMAGTTQEYILEHNHLSLTSYAPLLYVIIVIIILSIVVIKGKEKYKLKDIFMLLGLLFMSIISNRHFAFLASIGTIYLIRVLETYLKNKNNLLTAIINLPLMTYICIVEIIAVGLIKYALTDNTYLKDSIYPLEATNYIKENLDLDTMKLYNEYDFGSYLLYHDIKVYIDSRCDLYTKEFNELKYDIFDDFIYMAERYQSRFSYYGITHALLYKTNPLKDELTRDDDYQVIYEDEYFILYERQAKA